MRRTPAEEEVKKKNNKNGKRKGAIMERQKEGKERFTKKKMAKIA